MSSPAFTALCADLGMTVVERDWLNANQVLFSAAPGSPCTVVDTGFGAHATQTVAQLRHALGGAPLARIVNTHLHSDHCGGNHALQAAWPGIETCVPAVSLAAVRAWDEAALGFAALRHACPRFVADRGLKPGQTLQLAGRAWQIHAAPGHDPHALLFFEPATRTLIAGDALWQSRLAIIFPELDGDDGFGPTQRTLDLIAHLAPAWVVPGHGPAFSGVTEALAASRARLAQFKAEPRRHDQHAARALLMYELMARPDVARAELEADLCATPVFQTLAARLGERDVATWASVQVQQLLDNGWIAPTAAGRLHVAGPGAARA